MEDVNISIYRASVVREGSTPASPGFAVSEGQNPVDPSGSGQNHLPVTIATAATGLSITESQVLGGAGTVGQYIRGDGSLADFPESSGGGSSVSYYLNGSVAQGTIGGVAYKELNKVPILGAGTDFTINANGYIASFITDAGDPNLLEIPAGNWNFETYFSASSNGGSPTFYVELYKVNSGGTATLIASNSTFPELIAFGTNVISYFSTLAVPTTALALTDRLAIRYYVTHSGRTITLHTEDNHLCQIITTFTTGLTALNGLTAQIQNFAVGTSGTDFAIASATATHTFNLPTASATNRGALSSADWTTFNNKTSNLGTVTSVGLSSATSGVTIGSTPVTTSGTITLAIATASGSQNGLLSSTDWTTFNGKQNALTNPVTGTGTTNYLPKFTGSTTIGNSVIQEASSNIGIGVSPLRKLHVLSGTGIAQFQSSTSAGDIYLGDASSSSIDNQGIGSRGNNIVISAGGFERVTIASTGAATFSSSVTLTSGLLSVDGFANKDTNYITLRSGLSPSDSGGIGLKAIDHSGSSADGLACYGHDGISLYTAQIEKMRITSTGNIIVGYNQTTVTTIGRTFATTHASANRGATLFYGINDGSNGGMFVYNVASSAPAYNSQYITFETHEGAISAGERMRITTGGNVGIGTASPISPANSYRYLHIEGANSTSGGVLYLTTFGNGNSSQIYTDTSGLNINTNTSLPIIFNPAGAEQIRITSNGNLLIGTSTNGASKLRIVGLPTSSAGLSSGDVYNLSGVLMIA